jgi:hypothetical protein
LLFAREVLSFPEFSASSQVGVAQFDSLATALRLTVAFEPSGRRPVALASRACCEPLALPSVGVGHAAMLAASTSVVPEW